MSSGDEFFDAPETPGRRSKWEQWGYHYFKDGLQKANVDFLEPNKEEASIMRVAGRPEVDSSGQLVGILPFLRPRPSRRLSDPADKLFAPTVCYQVRVVRYMGPRPDMDEEGHRDGPPQLHFIDEWPPHVRRKYVAEGRQLPPTCVDILLAHAPSIVARYPKYQKYFKADDDFHSALRRPTNIWFLNGLCLNHGKVDCDEENPLPSLHLLTWTGYKSMLDLVLAENEGYVYPEGADHAMVGRREELAKRFVVPDLTNPDGAPALVFNRVKQKRKSSKGGKGGKGQMEGNRYVASLSDEIYPFPADLQQKMWTPPEDLFYYPSPEEAFSLMLNNAGEQEWLDFLVLLAKGTDLEIAESVRGVDTDDGDKFTPPAKAAPREAEEEEEEASAPSEAEDFAGDGEPGAEEELEAAAPPARPKAAVGGGKTLGLGVDFGKRKAGAVQLSEKEKNEDDIAPPSNMPVPEPSKVFGSDAAAPADVPESVEERTRLARERLAKMRGEQAS